MKHEWDYAQGGKTSVKIHNAPGILIFLLKFPFLRWKYLMEYWLELR